VLTYRDGKSGAETKVGIDSLTLSARDAQSPVQAEFRGKFDDMALAMTGQLGPLESLVQRRWPYPFTLDGEIDGQKAKIGARLRVDGETVHIEELEAAVGPNVVKGNVSVRRRRRVALHRRRRRPCVADARGGTSDAGQGAAGGSAPRTTFL
jgi:hypothetical protein